MSADHTVLYIQYFTKTHTSVIQHYNPKPRENPMTGQTNAVLYNIIHIRNVAGRRRAHPASEPSHHKDKDLISEQKNDAVDLLMTCSPRERKGLERLRLNGKAHFSVYPDIFSTFFREREWKIVTLRETDSDIRTREVPPDQQMLRLRSAPRFKRPARVKSWCGAAVSFGGNKLTLQF